MRRFTTTRDWLSGGQTHQDLYAAEQRGDVLRVCHGVYVDPKQGPVSQLDFAVARTIASGAMATGLVGAALYEFDAVEPNMVLVPRRRRVVSIGEPRHVEGVLVASGLQIITELAGLLSDLEWEQALESGLRRELFSIEDVEHLLPELSASRTHGAPRIRRVLRKRPKGAPPTGSMMETLMVQLARNLQGVPEPDRQVEVRNEHDDFVARVDLAWCDLGAFNELDGQQHKGQPVYDARRETAVVAATGWLVGRFTWKEVRYLPAATGRRLQAILEQARKQRRRAS